jgi:V/A-type H+-transporting ATPase subunit B
MRNGTGAGRTRADHPDLAAQLIASVARAREIRDLAELMGDEALTATDRSYLTYERTFVSELLNQGADEHRSLDDTLARGWRVASQLPRRELTMLSATDIERYHVSPGGHG